MKKAVILDLFGVLVVQDQVNTELVGLMIEWRQKGIKVFIVSNADEDLAAQQRAQFPSLFAACDKFYYSGETGFLKPDPKCFETILQENNLQAEDCIYFDDSEKNVAAAQGLGIESYIFEGVESTREKVSKD